MPDLNFIYLLQGRWIIKLERAFDDLVASQLLMRDCQKSLVPRACFVVNQLAVSADAPPTACAATPPSELNSHPSSDISFYRSASELDFERCLHSGTISCSSCLELTYAWLFHGCH